MAQSLTLFEIYRYLKTSTKERSIEFLEQFRKDRGVQWIFWAFLARNVSFDIDVSGYEPKKLGAGLGISSLRTWRTSIGYLLTNSKISQDRKLRLIDRILDTLDYGEGKLFLDGMSNTLREDNDLYEIFHAVFPETFPEIPKLPSTDLTLPNHPPAPTTVDDDWPTQFANEPEPQSKKKGRPRGK